MPNVIDYNRPGPLTSLDVGQESLVVDIPTDAVGVCKLAQGLIIEPDEAAGLGVSDKRQAERAIRRTGDLIQSLMALDAAPLHALRSPDKRVVGTCRHFATMSCALLRFRGIAARARCGFATYFEPGKSVDHWIAEYRHTGEGRWVRVDTEILGLPLVSHPEDLREGEFLTGGEAWALCRQGSADPAQFGVHGEDDAWGPAEIRGNAIRDLAALNKIEMLPWDNWGRMDASYDGETGAEYDELIDMIASVCASDDPSAIRDLYARDELSVPPALIG